MQLRFNRIDIRTLVLRRQFSRVRADFDDRPTTGFGGAKPHLENGEGRDPYASNLTLPLLILKSNPLSIGVSQWMQYALIVIIGLTWTTTQYYFADYDP